MPEYRTLREVFNEFPSGTPAAYVGQDLTVQLVGAGGFMTATVYDPQLIQADAFARANHTGTQSYTTITGLASVASTGAYADLSGKPVLATVATSGSYNDLLNKPSSFAPRVQTTASTAPLTPNADANDLAAVTAQATNLTVAAPTGTPMDGQVLSIRIRDNGTSRTITWNAAYDAVTNQLPTATIVGRSMVYRFMWNAGTSKWDIFAGSPLGATYQ